MKVEVRDLETGKLREFYLFKFFGAHLFMTKKVKIFFREESLRKHIEQFYIGAE